jgi:hypothetical protein
MDIKSNEYELPVVHITSAVELQISKQDAKSFHAQIRQRILDTGKGLFEYVETLKFFEKVLKALTGDSGATKQEDKEGDKELKDYIRSEITKYGKSFTTPRGAKFELFEAGTKYYYDKTNDPVLQLLERQLQYDKEQLEKRQEFLKGVPTEGMLITDEETGETYKVYPPYKTSTSSFKVTLPK